MTTVRLGKSKLIVPKNGFGALPIQRITLAETVHLLHKALDNGMYYFDTARFYTDSEEKLGAAFADRRDKVIISTKTGATRVEDFWSQLETSLRLLRTDYIDLYQFHNPAFCPKPGDGTGLYEAMLEARRQGKVRHIGITNHRMAVAHEAIDSGLYETLQFPFSYLASDDELALAEKCHRHDMGFIAMKGLAGGLINHAATAYAYLAQFDYVEPIWGIQRESELDEFISFQSNPPVLTDDMRAPPTMSTSPTSSTTRCSRPPSVWAVGSAAAVVPTTLTPPTSSSATMPTSWSTGAAKSSSTLRGECHL